MAVMKTSVTRKKGERSPHGSYEDLSDEEKRGERSSWHVYCPKHLTSPTTKLIFKERH